MGEFLQTLYARRDAAQRRAADARKKLAEAESEVGKWQAAITIETGEELVAEIPLDYPMTVPTVRRKEDVFMDVLEHAGATGIKALEIIDKVKPTLSRSYVYMLIQRLKDEDRLSEDENGRLVLKNRAAKSGP